MGQSARKSVSVVIAAREPLQRSIYEALTERGHKVAESCTALDDTLAAVRRAHPDVCVVDRELPGGGLAAIAALAGHGRRPRVIVIGGESPAEVRAALLAGASECVSETIEPEELAAAVLAAVGKKTQGRKEQR